jgi:hypothetical protein
MSGEKAVEASERLRTDARQLAERTTHLVRPSSSDQILNHLLDTQRSILEALRDLAEWHRRTIPGVHFAEHHDESADGVSVVVEQLDLAAQQAEGLQETLSRAYGASSVVRWFDEEQESPDHPVFPLNTPEGDAPAPRTGGSSR